LFTGPAPGRTGGGYVRRVTIRATTWVAPLLSVVFLVTGCSQVSDVGTAQATEPPPTPLTAGSPRSAGAVPPTSGYVFPVRSKAARFGRVHHDYPATDIFAPCGTQAVAATAGVVAEVSRKDDWTVRENDGGTRGGLSVSIVGTDGVRYYGSHLKSVVPVIVPGYQVRAGEVLGLVGHTGSARPTACHLHFGISPPCATGDWWNRRGVLSPYSFLTSWQGGGQRSPVKAATAWRADHGCPKAPARPTP
jgi:peptidoglycan LD-endopeptidase LytH